MEDESDNNSESDEEENTDSELEIDICGYYNTSISMKVSGEIPRCECFKLQK